MTKKENFIRAVKRDNPKWIPNGYEAAQFVFSPLVDRPSYAAKDAYGCVWEFHSEADGGTFPTHMEVKITDLQKWQDQIFIPDINSFDWSKSKAEADSINREETIVMGFMEMGLFERSCILLGMEEALVSYLLEPQLMEELLSTLADHRMDYARRYCEIIQPDIIWYGDDWGTQQNLFMPVDTWRRIIKPHTQRIYNVFKEYNVIINQHSCGRIETIFSDIVEMGADIFNPCQPCNNLEKLKKEYGDRIAFMGGIDSQFVLDNMQTTPDEVKKEVINKIAILGKGGGYIAAPSHDVPYKKELLDAMNDTIEKYGQYK